MGIDVAAGVVIAALPQAWFVVRGTRSAELSAAAWLALGKYGLIALGFAAWFAARPMADGFTTVAGAAVTMALTIVATWWSLRHVNKPQ
jgi:hypothetical protein